MEIPPQIGEISRKHRPTKNFLEEKDLYRSDSGDLVAMEILVNIFLLKRAGKLRFSSIKMAKPSLDTTSILPRSNMDLTQSYPLDLIAMSEISTFNVASSDSDKLIIVADTSRSVIATA